MQPVDEAFEALLDYLKLERGFDFTGYKRPSLVRRVRRQMQIVGVETFEDYQDHLEVHPEEFTALFNMILINVTGFFRDAEAWEELRGTILPRCCASGRRASCGCGAPAAPRGRRRSGLAMCLAEALGVEASGPG